MRGRLSLSSSLLTLAIACGNAGSDPGTPDQAASDVPPGWSEESHTDKGQANYAAVFPGDQVLRLDVTIAAADWQAMQDDMTSMLGPFGQGGMGPGRGAPDGGGGGMLPVELTRACEGKALGDACTATFMGMTVNSTCSNLVGALACLPAQGGGGPDGGMGGPPLGGGGVGLARDPIYVPCTVAFGGKQWYHVGVRYKGNSTLMSAWSGGVGKMPLRLEFDHYEDEHPTTRDQRIWGFKDLSLSNAWGDSSLLREKLANDIYRAAGVPTPHSAFYRIYVDFGKGPTYFGLYTANEVPGKAFLNEQFGDDGGNLYKPEGDGARLASFDKASFEKKTNEKAMDWSDVKALIAALNGDRKDAAAWRAALEKTFSAKGFLRWLAVNTLIQNWDVYGAMAHNYYLYGDPKDKTPGQLKWIAWDSSLAMQDSGGLGGGRLSSFEQTEVSAQWPLIRYLMDDPAYQTLYWGYLREAAAGAFNQSDAENKVRTAHALIAPYVTGNSGEIPGYTFVTDPATFAASVEEVAKHVRTRQQAAQQALAKR